MHPQAVSKLDFNLEIAFLENKHSLINTSVQWRAKRMLKPGRPGFFRPAGLLTITPQMNTTVTDL